MKIQILTFILILLGQISFGQQTTSNQKDELVFEKGLLMQQLIDEDLDLDATIYSKYERLPNSTREYAAYIKEKILRKSIEYYQELIDSFPNSSLLFRALSNKGVAERTIGEYEKAKKTFQCILDSKADDKERGGVGSGIMGEPYTNYKNRAAKELAGIYIMENNYREAIKYLDLTNKFPYRHFCGNAYAADEIYMSEMFARCYLGLNDTNSALKILLPNLLENGLADNSELVDLTTEILLKKNSKDELKAQYEKAFKSYKTKRNSDGHEKYFITFLNTEIEIASWRLEYTKPDEKQKEVENICKTSQFYKLISNQ